MDREAWCATVHEVPKSQTWLSDWTELKWKYIIQNAGLDKAQAGIKIAGRNTNNLIYVDDTTLMAESEDLKSLLVKVKEESEKVNSTLRKLRSRHLVPSLHGK